MDNNQIEKKLFDFTESIAGMKNDIVTLYRKIDVYSESLREYFHESVSNLSAIVDKQQKQIDDLQHMQQEIIFIQKQQGTQISSIQKTVDHMAALETRLTNHETRIAALEEYSKSERDIEKERVKGRWALVGSLLAFAASVAVAIINAFI